MQGQQECRRALVFPGEVKAILLPLINKKENQKRTNPPSFLVTAMQLYTCCTNMNTAVTALPCKRKKIICTFVYTLSALILCQATQVQAEVKYKNRMLQTCSL